MTVRVSGITDAISD